MYFIKAKFLLCLLAYEGHCLVRAIFSVQSGVAGNRGDLFNPGPFIGSFSDSMASRGHVLKSGIPMPILGCLGVPNRAPEGNSWSSFRTTSSI